MPMPVSELVREYEDDIKHPKLTPLTSGTDVTFATATAAETEILTKVRIAANAYRARIHE